MVQLPETVLLWSAMVENLDMLAVALVALTARAIYEVSGETSLLQWRAMAELHTAGSLRLSELAARLPSSVPATSRLVTRMTDRGLIVTRPVAGDARGLAVELSAAGRDLRAAVIERRRSLIDQGLGSQPMPDDLEDGLVVLGQRLRASSLAPHPHPLER